MMSVKVRPTGYSIYICRWTWIAHPFWWTKTVSLHFVAHWCWHSMLPISGAHFSRALWSTTCQFLCRVVPTQVNVEEWQKRLGYPTFNVTKRTLESTTQFVNSVEAETREYIHDHWASWLPMLRPLLINDTCFQDVFFSSVNSIQSYTCFLVNALLHSQVDDVRLMRRESEVCDHFQDFIRQVSAPKMSVPDCTSSFLGKAWKAILQKYCIDDHATKPYHQNRWSQDCNLEGVSLHPLGTS